MVSIATLLGVDPVPMGSEGEEEKPPSVAVIDEQECIGCTICIKYCPVDAIVGATRLMHTVIASECTGCEKCVEPCPVDCIYMEPIKIDIKNWNWPIPEGEVPGEIAVPMHEATG